MRVNCEVLLVIDAEDIESADELATYIVKDIAEVYGPLNANPDDSLPGIVALASVEAVAPKRRVA